MTLLSHRAQCVQARRVSLCPAASRPTRLASGVSPCLNGSEKKRMTYAPAGHIGIVRGQRASFAQARAVSSDSEDAPPAMPLSGWKVFVAGATGGVGKEVVSLLSSQGADSVALVRDVAKASALPSTGVEVVKGDVFQFATLPKAMTGCNAVICCTGANDPRDPLGPFNIDFQGTLNLIAAARQKGIKKFIFVTSIGADDLINPLNLFWGVLFWKKRAEEGLQRSGLEYTIVRPGGLKNKLRDGETKGNVVMGCPGMWGVPPAKKSGSILRSQVAEVCVAALTEEAAVDKVVEVIAETTAPAKTMGELFASV